MPRKRIIDPEFWSDEEIGQWTPLARLFYIGLWNFADDEGKFKAHNNLLKSQIFPYDKIINMELLKKEISSKIQWYQNNGNQYGFIRNFLKHQRIDRPTPSKLPAPQEQFDEASTKPREQLAPNISKVNISKENIYNNIIPPTYEQVFNYCKERNNLVDAQKFIDFYSSKGWMIGKNIMKDWKAAIRTWERREQGEPVKPKVFPMPKL